MSTRGRHGNHARGERVQRIEMSCERCGTVIRLRPAELRARKVVRFCSHRCARLKPESYVTLPCERCGVSVQRHFAHVKGKTYCSKACYAADRRAANARWRDKSAIREYMRSYVERHKEKLNQRARERNAANPERARARRKRWRDSNPVAISLAAGRRRASYCGGDLTAATWLRILDIAGGACLCCGATDRIGVDHVVPISRGGEHSASNVQPLCRACNAQKSARTKDFRSPEFIAAVNRIVAIGVAA